MLFYFSICYYEAINLVGGRKANLLNLKAKLLSISVKFVIFIKKQKRKTLCVLFCGHM